MHTVHTRKKEHPHPKRRNKPAGAYPANRKERPDSGARMLETPQRFGPLMPGILPDFTPLGYSSPATGYSTPVPEINRADPRNAQAANDVQRFRSLLDGGPLNQHGVEELSRLFKDWGASRVNRLFGNLHEGDLKDLGVWLNRFASSGQAGPADKIQLFDNLASNLDGTQLGRLSAALLGGASSGGSGDRLMLASSIARNTPESNRLAYLGQVAAHITVNDAVIRRDSPLNGVGFNQQARAAGEVIASLRGGGLDSALARLSDAQLQAIMWAAAPSGYQQMAGDGVLLLRFYDTGPFQSLAAAAAGAGPEQKARVFVAGVRVLEAMEQERSVFSPSHLESIAVREAATALTKLKDSDVAGVERALNASAAGQQALDRYRKEMARQGREREIIESRMAPLPDPHAGQTQPNGALPPVTSEALQGDGPPDRLGAAIRDAEIAIGALADWTLKHASQAGPFSQAGLREQEEVKRNAEARARAAEKAIQNYLEQIAAPQLGAVNSHVQRLTAAEATRDEDAIAQAQGALRTELEKQFKEIALSVPPDATEFAGLVHRQMLETLAPQDARVQGIVQQAYNNVFVKPRVDSIETAYDNNGDKGAEAAAAELEAQTRDVTSELAARVLKEAVDRGTISKIADTLWNRMHWTGYGEFGPAYSNISKTVERAAHGVHAAQLVQDVARLLAASMPGLTGRQGAPNVVGLIAKGPAIADSIRQGNGAALPMTMAWSLDQAGRRQEAYWVRSQVGAGMSLLHDRVGRAVEDFVKATSVVRKLRNDWAPFASGQAELDRATLEYAGENLELISGFHGALLSMDTVAAQAFRSYHIAGRDLTRLPENAIPQILKDSWNALSNDNKFVFAMSLSDRAADELRSLMDNERANAETWDVRGANYVKPAGAGRSVLIEAAKVTANTMSATSSDAFLRLLISPYRDFSTKVISLNNIKMDPAKAVPGVGALNALGISLYGQQILNAYFNYESGRGNYYDTARGLYGTAGLVKEAAETMSVVIQNTPQWGWSPKVASMAAYGPLASSNRGITLPILRKVAEQPGWVKFATYFKLSGVNLDGYSALRSFTNGRLADGIGYSVSAGGGWFATASSLFIREYKDIYLTKFNLTREAANKIVWIGKFGPAVGGGVSLLASAALAVYQDCEAAAEYEKPAADFLAKLGYRPEAARQLADYDSDGRSPGPAIGAWLSRARIRPEAFRSYVNRMPHKRLQDLNRLAVAARRVPIYEDETFPRWAPNDDNIARDSSSFLYGRAAIFNRNVRSLEGLGRLARDLLPDFPGTAP
jgi:hypothetical protein